MRFIVAAIVAALPLFALVWPPEGSSADSETAQKTSETYAESLKLMDQYQGCAVVVAAVYAKTAMPANDISEVVARKCSGVSARYRDTLIKLNINQSQANDLRNELIQQGKSLSMEIVSDTRYPEITKVAAEKAAKFLALAGAKPPE